VSSGHAAGALVTYTGLCGEGGQGNGQGRDGRGEELPGGGSLSQEQVPHFYQLPPPRFPPKNEFGTTITKIPA
jgi:hypothetical protein